MSLQEVVEEEVAAELNIKFLEWKEMFLLDSDDGDNSLDPNFMLGVRLTMFAIQLLLLKVVRHGDDK